MRFSGGGGEKKKKKPRGFSRICGLRGQNGFRHPTRTSACARSKELHIRLPQGRLDALGADDLHLWMAIKINRLDSWRDILIKASAIKRKNSNFVVRFGTYFNASDSADERKNRTGKQAGIGLSFLGSKAVIARIKIPEQLMAPRKIFDPKTNSGIVATQKLPISNFRPRGPKKTQKGTQDTARICQNQRWSSR